MVASVPLKNDFAYFFSRSRNCCCCCGCVLSPNIFVCVCLCSARWRFWIFNTFARLTYSRIQINRFRSRHAHATTCRHTRDWFGLERCVRVCLSGMQSIGLVKHSSKWLINYDLAWMFLLGNYMISITYQHRADVPSSPLPLPAANAFLLSIQAVSENEK